MPPWEIQVKIVANKPAVLLSLAKPHLQGGQALIIRITGAISQLLEMGAKVSLKPSTDEDHNNTTQVHTLTCKATEKNSEVNPPPGCKSSFGRRLCDGFGPILHSTGRTTSYISVVYRVCWEAQMKVRKVNQTPSRGPRQYGLYWTSPRRHRGFAVVRHKDSLTMGTAMGHGRP
jgi:hypothetical protein